MAVTVENLEGLMRKTTLSIPWSDIRSQVAARLRNTQRRARIDGFRPGKAPMRMIESMYGASIQNDVLNDSAVDMFYRLAGEEKWKVATLQNLTATEKQEDENNFTVDAVFEVIPDVVIPDMSEKEVERVCSDITDDDMERTIEILRKQRAVFNYVERPAQNGDRVIIDFDGKIDGTPFAGGKAENYPFVLGEGRMLPEFEAGLIGMKEGESNDVSVTFPDDYHGKDVAGKTAVFTISLKNVAEYNLPEINEQFAMSLGIEDGNVDTMREEIKKNIEREVKRRTDSMTKENVMKVLLDNVSLPEIPKSLLSQEVSRLRSEMEGYFKSQGMKPEQMGKLEDSFFEERAKRRVSLGLIISEIVDKNDLRATDAQVRKVINEFAESYEDPEEVIKYYLNSKDNMQGPIALATEANVVEFILSKAKVTDKNITFDEVMYGGNIQA